MKKFLQLLLCVIVLASVFSCAQPTSGSGEGDDSGSSGTVLLETDVPDAELRRLLEDILGKSFGQITDEDMAGIDSLSLNCDDYSVSDLTGIEYCTGLWGFYFWNSNITDYSELIYLDKLEVLTIRDSVLSDPSQLSSLTGLTTLYLYENEIDDLSFISGFSNLEKLKLGENPLDITDLSVITSVNFPNLEYLKLDNGYSPEPIDMNTDFDALCNILKSLDKLINLEMDDFYMGNVDFQTLYTKVLEPRKLEWENLALTDNDMGNSSLALLANLENLEILDLFANDITDLSAITGMTNLRVVSFEENEITDLAPLKTLYDNGGLRADSDANVAELNIELCNLDLRTGTANKEIIDYLVSGGVSVTYTDGNAVDSTTPATSFGENLTLTGTITQAFNTNSFTVISSYSHGGTDYILKELINGNTYDTDTGTGAVLSLSRGPADATDCPLITSWGGITTTNPDAKLGQVEVRHVDGIFQFFTAISTVLPTAGMIITILRKRQHCPVRFQLPVKAISMTI